MPSKQKPGYFILSYSPSLVKTNKTNNAIINLLIKGRFCTLLVRTASVEGWVLDKSFLVTKLMFMIWYVDRPDAFVWADGLVCTAKLGPIARSLGTTNYRLKDYFVRLEQLGAISDLKAKYGEVTFKAVIPPPIVRNVMEAVL